VEGTAGERTGAEKGLATGRRRHLSFTPSNSLSTVRLSSDRQRHARPEIGIEIDPRLCVCLGQLVRTALGGPCCEH
jgi:hypothetical protein